MGRWIGIFVGDAVTDLAIALSAASVIWRTQAAFRVRLMWYFPFCLRICVPVCAGLRLLATSKYDLTHDPTLALWLFVVSSQIQILLSIIGYTSPALKRTMFDLVTNYGVVSDSQAGCHAQNGGSYAMKELRYYKASVGAPWQGSDAGKQSVRVASSSFKADALAERGDVDSDGDSQKGIIRRDDVEISYTRATPESRANERWDSRECQKL
ncbi:hypothetical protein LTR08_005399 [Meristemomyces frigidus]|nr:hypothetical protein LTR08_005399 [Meristemomyces frigidus]